MLLEAQDISFSTPDGKPLVSDMSFHVKAGECLLISGVNGTGKSTLLKVILGLLKVTKGRFTSYVRESEMAILPQLQNTEFHLPVTLQDVLNIYANGRVTDEDVVKVALLDPRQLSLSWNTASGGERKRTLLTRLLLHPPRLLLLDEPMNHLDPESREKVLMAVEKFKLAGGTVVMVSHESAVQGRLSNVKLLRLGHVPAPAEEFEV